MSTGEELSGPDLIERFLQQYASDQTRYTYRRYLEKFDRDKGLREVARADGRVEVEDWLSRPSIGESSTFNGYESVLGTFYDWAVGQGLLSVDPTVGIKRRGTKKGPPSPISHSALARALDEVSTRAEDPVRMRALLLLASGAGCTQKEIAELAAADVIDREGTPYLRIRGGKSGQQREVPLRKDVLEAFDEAYALAGGTGWERKPGQVGREINRYLQERCHISASAYDLRHRYGYDTFLETNDLFETQRRMGFKTPGAALVYMSQLDDLQANVDAERLRRLALWSELAESKVAREAIGEFRRVGTHITVSGAVDIRPGGDEVIAESSAAISVVLATGTVLDDSLDDVLYRPTEDASVDLGSLEVAKALQLPIFVLAGAEEKDGLRAVRLGWVEGVNEEAGLALLSLGELPPAGSDESDAQVGTTLIISRVERQVLRTVRSGQRRFKFRVLERYGPRCAVCDLDFAALLEAAHICPWAEYGADDPSNGLVLCPLHHRAFDSGYWAVEPDTLGVMPRSEGPSLADLWLTHDSLLHLRNAPSEDALRYAWERRWRPGRRRDDSWQDHSSPSAPEAGRGH